MARRQGHAPGIRKLPVARVPEFAAVVPVSTRLRTAKQESSFYERMQSISASRKEKEEELSGRKLGALKEIEDKLNRTMRKIVSSVFGELRKSPHIRLGESNYTYEVFEDTGTGTAYTSFIVLDLAVYGLTQLPFLIHDSLLFKNIENKAVSNLLNLYNAGAKQCFDGNMAALPCTPTGNLIKLVRSASNNFSAIYATLLGAHLADRGVNVRVANTTECVVAYVSLP